MRNAFLLVTMLVGATLCLGAEIYPSKPVRVIVNQGPGGSTDFAARVIAQQLSDQLGKSFVVDNRAGASGIIGYGFVAKSPSDGYTLTMADATFAVAPGMQKTLPYDPVKDFTPITQIMRVTNVLVVSPSLNVGTLKEFITLAQARPAALNYGSGGTGSATHLWGELFKTMAKVNLTHVPYKGGGEAMAALLGGEIQMQMPSIPTALGQIKGGKLRALAVTTDGPRSLLLPDVPSMIEAGIPGTAIYAWQGLIGPGGIPKEVVNKLNAEVRKALTVPAVREKLISQSAELVDSNPEAFSQFIRTELQRWAEVIKSAGITLQ